MNRSEAYWDIVWRQFKKNRFALWALWLLAPLGLVALFAPLLASDQPLVFVEENGVLFPWFRALFNAEESVDFVFNMGLLAFLPWALGGWILNRSMRRRALPGRRRAVVLTLLLLALTAGLVVLFSIDRLRPRYQYTERTFVVEQFQSGGKKWGWYPLIPFGPAEQDRGLSGRPETGAVLKKPFFRKPRHLRYKANDYFPHILGTDNLGRDVLVQMIYGTRIALTIGFVAVGIYIVIGVVVGAAAGYFGGLVDMLLSRVMEVVMLFPSFFLILTLVAFFRPNIYIIMVVIGLTRWAPVARLIRGEVLKQRTIDYVVAAQAVGASHLRILFRHILPNAISPALVSAPFGIAGAIIIEGGLSLLGMGVQPPTPTWGTLLKLGKENFDNWWLVVVPSAAMFLTVTLFNLVGSGLRDAMDPRLRV